MKIDEALKILNTAGLIAEKHSISKLEWNSLVCPPNIAKKVLEDAGYDYDGCLKYQGETVENPYTRNKEKVLTWTTVGYLLKDKGIIDFDDDYICVKLIKDLVK